MKTDFVARGGRLVLAAALALGAGLPAGAQTVYRCGPDGRSYSHQPCADGRVVKADDVRTPSERSDAEAAAARQSTAAAALERQRRRDERVAARTGPAGFRTGPAHRAADSSTAVERPSKASAKTSKALRRATQEARQKAPRLPPQTKKAA